MIMINIRYFLVSLVVSAFLAGCGSDDSGENRTANLSGGLIEGVEYDCAGKTGVTDAYGGFNYVPGEACSFKVGAFVFEADPKALSDRQVLLTEIGENEEEVLKLALILRSVSKEVTHVSRKIDMELAAKVPVISLEDDIETIKDKLQQAGIRTKSLTMIRHDLARFFDPETGELILTTAEQIASVDASYVKRFPMIAAKYKMTERDFEMYVGNNPSGSIWKSTASNAAVRATDGCTGCKPLGDLESIKTLSLGSKIFSGEGNFLGESVFDLLALDQDNYIVHDDRASVSISTIEMITNASATSSLFSESAALSLKRRGTFHASASAKQSYQKDKTTSDTKTTLCMTNALKGITANINIDMSPDRTYNFAEYLNGIPLTQAQVDGNASNVYDANGTVTDIDITTFSGAQTPGVIIYDNAPYRANIQLLGRMENMYAELDRQNTDLGGSDPDTLSLMDELRGYIVQAVLEFRYIAGDQFVNQVDLMSWERGQGEMQISQKSKTITKSYAGTLAAGYVGVGSTAGSLNFNIQNGWATSYNQTQVQAESFPGTAYDASQMASDINSMLKSATTSISVPASTPQDAVAFPDPPDYERPKGPDEAPESCFKSYEEWKNYTADRKEKEDGEGKEAEEAEGKDMMELVEEGIDLFALVEGDNKEGDALVRSGALADTGVFEEEWTALRALRKKQMSGGTAASAAQIEPRADSSDFNSKTYTPANVLTGGFDSTAYQLLIPQLMPDFSETSDADADADIELDAFVNGTRLMVFIDHLNQLNTYLRFLGNITDISKVADRKADDYDNLYNQYFDEAYDLIGLALAAGTDVADSDYNALQAKYFGSDPKDLTKEQCGSSVFCEQLGYDFYNYTRSLMKDPNENVWRSAPAGYVPMFQGKQHAIFFQPEKSKNSSLRLTDDDTKNFVTVTRLDDMVRHFYYDRAQDPNWQKYQTPWFPVFLFEGTKETELVFTQFMGPYVIVYTRSQTIYPGKGRHNSDSIYFDSMEPKEGSNVERVAQILTRWIDENKKLGFSDEMSWDYAIYTNDVTLDEKYADERRVLLLHIKKSIDSDEYFDEECWESHHDDKGFYVCSPVAVTTYQGSDHYVSDAVFAHINTNGMIEKVTIDQVVPSATQAYMMLYPLKKNDFKDDSVFTYATTEPIQGEMNSQAFQNYYDNSALKALR